MVLIQVNRTALAPVAVRTLVDAITSRIGMQARCLELGLWRVPFEKPMARLNFVTKR